MKIDHLQLAIPTGAEPECRNFWIDLLGFTELPKPAELATRGGAWFALDGVEIHLGVETGFSPAKKAHPAFSIAQIDLLADKLDNAGHPVNWDAAIAGRRRFFTSDPVGNRLEFIAG